jgi:hypothetical protein
MAAFQHEIPCFRPRRERATHHRSGHELSWVSNHCHTSSQLCHPSRRPSSLRGCGAFRFPVPLQAWHSTVTSSHSTAGSRILPLSQDGHLSGRPESGGVIPIPYSHLSHYCNTILLSFFVRNTRWDLFQKRGGAAGKRIHHVSCVMMKLLRSSPKTSIVAKLPETLVTRPAQYIATPV